MGLHIHRMVHHSMGSPLWFPIQWDPMASGRRRGYCITASAIRSIFKTSGTAEQSSKKQQQMHCYRCSRVIKVQGIRGNICLGDDSVELFSWCCGIAGPSPAS